ncbi:MAG: bifunctional phosphoglucose/phosphomannose isomerase [Saprospiraceae bacterium]|nr:bifunctional phosphoglucose/phosphomannose isomerase [Saprospiraceae bacterium]
MMDTLIDRFPAQLKEALEIGKAATVTAPTQPINKIYVAGLGGSGIGGDFVAEMIKDECKVPYLIGKGYSIPSYIDENTIAIISSYSGNTEETLTAFDLLEKTGAKIICIASGGKVIARAKEAGYDYIQVPGDWPSPRACLGFSLVQQIYVLEKLGFISATISAQIKTSIDVIKYDQDDIKAEAKKIATKLYGKTPVIYTTDRMESVAVRLRQQINENAKLLCWHHVIPEMNHNELVGWKAKRSDIAVLYLRNKDDFKRNATRIDINKTIISKLAGDVIEVYSKGKSLPEKMMYFVNLGDWVSWYMSEMHGVDSIEVDVIDYLKGELAKV